MEKIKDKQYVKSEMFEIEPQDLNEDFWENALLITGFIPVIGEVADVILIIRYWRQDRKIEAGLMLLALIPTVGDFLVKPFLKIGKAAGAFKTSQSFMKFLAENPQARAAYAKIGKQMDNPAIGKLISQVQKKTPQGAEALTGALTLQKGLFQKVSSSASKVGTTLEKGVGKSIKQGFQNQALQKYLIKTGGVAPSNFLSRWWNVVYKGRLARKAAVKKLIFGSNLLGVLGFPNIESLEKAMADPKQAEELMKNPEFANFYNQATTPEEQQALMQPEQTQQEPEQQDSGLGNILGGATSFIGLNALKSLARFV